MQTGFPFEPATSTDFFNRLNIYVNHPMRTCDGTLPRGVRTPAHWFDTSCFPLPGTNVIGNSGFGILHYDDLVRQDFTVMRNFPIHERLELQFRTEFFNIFNHPIYAAPDANAQSATFGKITAAAVPGRQIQFALKLSW
jgi:hypothetical protein